jgi:hypothetical protein
MLSEAILHPIGYSAFLGPQSRCYSRSIGAADANKRYSFNLNIYE